MLDVRQMGTLPHDRHLEGQVGLKPAWLRWINVFLTFCRGREEDSQMVSPLQPRSLTSQPWRNSLQPCKRGQELERFCTQVQELYRSAAHNVIQRVRLALLLSSSTFYRPTGTCRAQLISLRTFGPSTLCLFLCPRHLEESDYDSLCPAVGSTSACTSNDHQHAGSPHAAHHLCSGGLRLLELGGQVQPLQSLWGLVLVEVHCTLCY